MIEILKMTATFGRLDGDTLELTGGLNIFTAPNEAGKSTWAAFLTAMFYGIDTAERAKKGTLPAKTKYKPWSGKPMEGVVELNWNGRHITIQRQSDTRAPMGKFTAYDTLSGETIPELTAENCGRTLLGVESSVFIRSAFIGQNAMAVSQDPGLEQKLSGLVTTGDESVSYTQTERRLRDWKNHVRHNKTGYLPEAEELLASVEDKLARIRQYHKDDLELSVRQEVLTEELTKLRYAEKNLKAAEAQEKRRQLLAAEARLAEAEQALAAAEKAAENLPEQKALTELSMKLAQYKAVKNIAENAQPPEPVKHEPHPIFGDKTPEEAMEQALDDLARISAYNTPLKMGDFAKTRSIVGFFGLALMLLFLLPMFQAMNWGLFVWILVGICCLLALYGLWLRKEIRKGWAKADEIRARYGYISPHSQAEQYQLDRKSSENRYKWALEEYHAQQKNVEAQEQAILDATRAFAESIYSTDDVQKAIETASEYRRQAENAKTAARAARQNLDAVRAAVGNVEDAPVEEDFSDRYSLPQLARLMAQTEQELHSVQTELAQHAGLVQSLGDPAALEAEKQLLESRIHDLKLRESALAAAMAALDEANRLQRSRFSPQITKAAGEILCRMTAGRYDALRMEQDLTLHAKATGEAVTRELLTLSGGTGDQLYLALRLAICDLVLESGTPLVLDDALVYFDDDRLAQTMELLKEESEKRQILLFSCQKREMEYIKNTP